MLLPVQECGKGVNLDLLPSELAPGIWSDSSNVRFRNGFAETRKGIAAAYTTPTAIPYWIGTFNTATARFLVMLGLDSAFVDDGSTRTDITGTPPTGDRDSRWTAFDFNGTFVCNNGVDDPMYWNGDTSSNLATLTGWTAGTTADALCTYKDYIFALAPTISGTKYPYRLMWGNAAEPGSLPSTYTAAATNDAGDKDVTGIGHLVDGLVMGDALIIYGQEGRVAVRYIGGDLVFSINRLPGKDGLLNRGCVVSTPRGHVFLTNGDVRLHSGGESVSIAEGVVRDYLAENMDATSAPRAFLCLNPQETEVWVVYPSSGSEDCDSVLAWNWVDETWAKLSVPDLTYGTSGLVSSGIEANIWSSQTQTWSQVTNAWSQNETTSNEARLILATTTPTIGLANVGDQDFGSSVSWYLEKSGIPLSQTADEIKPLSRIKPKLKAIPGTEVTVKLTTTKGPDEDPSFATSSTYTQGTTNWVSQVTSGGNYGAVRFEGSSAVAMRSYQLEVAESGARF